MTDKRAKNRDMRVVPKVSSTISKHKTKDLDEVEDMIQPMLTLMLVMIILSLLPFIVSSVYNSMNPAVPSSGEDYPTAAQYVGMFYYKITPEVQPNELRMIGENSTGAFEHILVSKST